MWGEIRKFGLRYCDLPTMMWNVAVLLRVLTLNIDNKYTDGGSSVQIFRLRSHFYIDITLDIFYNNLRTTTTNLRIWPTKLFSIVLNKTDKLTAVSSGIPFYYYIITIVSATCYFYVYLFSMLWFVFWRCIQTGEMVPAMVVLSLGISSEIGTLKLVYMFVCIDTIKKIADDYLECDSHVVPGSRFSINLLKSLRSVKKRAIVYWMVLVGNGTLYILKAALTRGKHLTEDYYVVYGLEPIFESPNYEIVFLIMAAGIFFICYVPASVTAYLIVIAGYTESQMLALSNEMLQLWADATEEARIQEISTNNNEIIHEIINRRLKDIIRRHAIVLNLYIQVENVFRGAIAMGFVLLILGLIAELLGKLENTYLQMPFAYMQVAMDCFTGQKVMDASVEFERAIYECKWENFDKTNMKMVLMMLQNAQKTMSLSAGGLTTLSFSCLMSVTRAIYSAYTALRTTMY